MDIVVSNVGMRRMQAFLDIGLADWDAVLATNLTPAFYLARNAIPHMQKKKWDESFSFRDSTASGDR